MNKLKGKAVISLAGDTIALNTSMKWIYTIVSMDYEFLIIDMSIVSKKNYRY